MISGPPPPGSDDINPQLVGQRPAETSRERYFRTSVWTMIVVLVLLSPANLLVLGWLTEAYRETEAASDVSHRLHEVVFGILFSLALVGAITQLVGPKRNRAGLIQLAVVIFTLWITVGLTVAWDPGMLLFLVPLIGIFLFRPRDAPLRSGPVWRWAVLLLVGAGLPFLIEAAGQVARALAEAQNHTTHWSAMATFVIVLLVLAGLVAFRVTGYRVVALSIAGAAGGYGLVSLIFPYDASSHTPSYAGGLILWAAAWLVCLMFLDRPALKPARKVAAILRMGILLPAALIASMVWGFLDDPSNVPHRPNPNLPELTASEVDRSTCLECHATGIVGAPMPPHELTRSCEDEPCWGGSSDCAGCHRIDPALGGASRQIEVRAVDLGPVTASPDREVTPLNADDLAHLHQLAVGG
jgi:hypothetical protein